MHLGSVDEDRARTWPEFTSLSRMEWLPIRRRCECLVERPLPLHCRSGFGLRNLSDSISLALFRLSALLGTAIFPQVSLVPFNRSPCYNEAAASTAPTPLKAALFVTTISTGYFHSIYFFHPIVRISLYRLSLLSPAYPNRRTSFQNISRGTVL